MVEQELPSPLPASVTLRPAVSPVRNLTLDGVPAATARSGVGTTPVLAWDAPVRGTPTSYSVRVYHYSVSASGSSLLNRTLAAQVITQSRSLRIPAGVLVAGETYVFIVTAEQNPRFDPQAPLRAGATVSYAQALTSPIVP